jgi:hypothetical protein
MKEDIHVLLTANQKLHTEKQQLISQINSQKLLLDSYKLKLKNKKSAELRKEKMIQNLQDLPVSHLI